MQSDMGSGCLRWRLVLVHQTCTCLGASYSANTSVAADTHSMTDYHSTSTVSIRRVPSLVFAGPWGPFRFSFLWSVDVASVSIITQHLLCRLQRLEVELLAAR